MSSGRFRSAFDRLFDDPAQSENLALDDLIDIMDEDEGSTSVESDEDSVVISQGMLSQGGQDAAERVIREVKDDPERALQLDAACPNWEENVLFAMFQKDEASIREALRQVESHKAKLAERRRALMRAIAQRAAALDIFEKSLSESLGRLVETKNVGSDGFMFSQLPPTTEKCISEGRRRSCDDDVTTLHASASPALGRASLLLTSPGQ